MSQHAPPFSSVLPSPCDRRICPAFRTILPLAACSSVLPPAISAPFAHLHPSICASSMARRGVAWPPEFLPSDGNVSQAAASLPWSLTAVGSHRRAMADHQASSPRRDLLLPVNAQRAKHRVRSPSFCSSHHAIIPGSIGRLEVSTEHHPGPGIWHQDPGQHASRGSSPASPLPVVRRPSRTMHDRHSRLEPGACRGSDWTRGLLPAASCRPPIHRTRSPPFWSLVSGHWTPRRACTGGMDPELVRVVWTLCNRNLPAEDRR